MNRSVLALAAVAAFAFANTSAAQSPVPIKEPGENLGQGSGDRLSPGDEFFPDSAFDHAPKDKFPDSAFSPGPGDKFPDSAFSTPGDPLTSK